MSVTAERIKELRKQKNLTQQGLADQIKSSRDTIANYENDRNKSTLAMLSLIADALDTTAEYLQGKTDNPLKTPHSGFANGDESIPLDLKNTLDNSNLLLSFDGKEIDEEDKQAIIELLKFRRFQKRNEDK